MGRCSRCTCMRKIESLIELANDGAIAWHALHMWLLNPIDFATLGWGCDFANIVITLLQEWWVSNWLEGISEWTLGCYILISSIQTKSYNVAWHNAWLLLVDIMNIASYITDRLKGGDLENFSWNDAIKDMVYFIICTTKTMEFFWGNIWWTKYAILDCN